jgi:acyl-CoA thioesterase
MNYNYLTKINIMDKFKQFQDAIEINKVSDSLYKIIPSEKFFVGNTPHGGYLMAIMHKALISSLPHSCAISSSIQYLDRAEPREIDIHVDVIRVSRGSSTGRVTIMQDNLVKCIYTGTCSDFEHMKGYNGLATPIPLIFKTIDKKDFKNLDYDNVKAGFTPAFVKQVECFVHPDHAWWDREISNEDAEARCSAYISLPGGIPDQYAISFFSDILPPVVSNKYGPLGWVPTLTLTTHIRQMPKTEVLVLDFLAKDINNGYFEQDCNIWDLEGNLVASSRQLTRILKSEEKISI